MKKMNTAGFTLVELLIATAVFSVVLLICTFGLISVGRSYYKGVTVTRTQEVARTIMDDITQSIQFGGGVIQTALSDDPGTAVDDTVEGFCVDNRRYSFTPLRILTDSSADHGLVVDNPGVACSSGLYVQNIREVTLPNVVGSRELLLPNMRVINLSVVPVSGSTNLYKVTVEIASGDDATLEPIAGSPDPNKRQCVRSRIESQFCAVSSLTSIVQKRIE